MKLRELYWFGAILIVILFTSFMLVGFAQDSVLDINIHDTYFVINTTHLIFIIGVLLFFWVYLFRMLWNNFKNIVINVVFIVANLLLIMFNTKLISAIDRIAQPPGQTIYPPLSSSPVEHGYNDFNTMYNVLLIGQVVLSVFLVYCGYKTGQNYIRKN